MGKKSRRDRAAYGPLRPRGPTPRRSDDGVRLQPARRGPSTQPKLTVAEAEAEFRAAIAAIPPRLDNEEVKIYEDARCIQALAALTRAVTIDEDDKKTMGEYLTKSAAGDGIGNEELIKLVKRWPRIRNYWPRVRRRICWGCGKEYDLSEPRLWVCGGCGEARYCDEACQSAHWPEHKTPCLKTFHEKTKKSLSRGVSVEKLRQAYLEAYHDDGAARVFSAMDKK